VQAGLYVDKGAQTSSKNEVFRAFFERKMVARYRLAEIIGQLSGNREQGSIEELKSRKSERANQSSGKKGLSELDMRLFGGDAGAGND
jgi:hypothetical protein